MSRVIKRVPLDFDWPLSVVWEGYLMPERLREAPCPEGVHCVNGSTAASAWVEKVVYLLLMLDDDRRYQEREQPMHPYFDSLPKPYTTGEDLFAIPRGRRGFVPRPSPDIAEFGTGLAGRDGNGLFGHDACDQWEAYRKIIAAAGLDPELWGVCPVCEGHASVEAWPGQRAEIEAWERTEPPAGEGWQLWETVSEGSPVSAVFGSDEELARWLTTPEGGQAIGPPCQPLTMEQARGFVRAGWAPSFTGDAGGLHGGVEHVGTYTALSVLLDRSGSMQPIRSDAEGGLRALIAEQRAEPGRVTLRLAQFDDRYELVHPSQPLDQVGEPSLEPRGRTALLDAWGRAVTEFGAELAALPEDRRPGNVIFVVITDGLENASVEWTQKQVFDKVREQTDQWGWKFLYLGADQDAIAEGAKYGVPSERSVSYGHDSSGTQAAFASASSAVTRTRGGGPAGFTETERRAMRTGTRR